MLLIVSPPTPPFDWPAGAGIVVDARSGGPIRL
jgi:hypothetical protein